MDKTKSMKKVKIEDSIGIETSHDMTEIREGFKGPAFKKGHKIEYGDICRLIRIGKRHLYNLEIEEDDVHENDAVLDIANALSGNGIEFDPEPSEGKIELKAATEGLLKVKTHALINFNMSEDVMCASLHNNFPVKKGDKIAGTRALPLIIKKDKLEAAIKIADDNFPIFSIKEFRQLRTRLIVTGNEVFDRVIEDKFENIIKDKLEDFNVPIIETVILPDDDSLISDTIKSFIEKNTELIIITGGMSVDPDDVSGLAVEKSGLSNISYGAGCLPGAMFMSAFNDKISVIGVPACAIYHKTTIFDIMLPRILASEKISKKDMAEISAGGLCLGCNICRYPACSFGKTF